MVGPNSPLILHIVTNDWHEEIGMSANCKYCRKQPSMIIRGNHLCSLLQRCRHQVTQDLAAITHLGETRHSLILILRTTFGSA